MGYGQFHEKAMKWENSVIGRSLIEVLTSV